MYIHYCLHTNVMSHLPIFGRRRRVIEGGCRGGGGDEYDKYDEYDIRLEVDG